MKKHKRILAAAMAVLALAGVCLLSGCGSKKSSGDAQSSAAHDDHSSGADENMTALSVMETVKDMGLGINLGNTFEACGSWINNSKVQNYETAWGSPIVTQEMIQGYANEGFGVLRIPVAWSNMMSEDYTIHPDYLARVHEVTDWALDAGMYVLLNIHWDGGWFENFADDAQKDECMKKYKRVWDQLSAEFGDEGSHLVFESLNEEGCWDSIWNRYGGGSDAEKQKAFGLLNEINQTFVDLVRGTGGKNAERCLLIAGYATDVDMTCDPMFKMPQDPAGRSIVSVHYYTPPTFCILEEDADWGKARASWGSPGEINEMKKYMDKLKTTFVDQGIPVIIGEYGCPHKNKENDSIQKFVTNVCQMSLERGICPVLWDTTGNFYDRSTGKMTDQALHDMMFALLNGEAQAAA